MNTSQMIALKIKKLSKQQKKPINKMLSECELNRNFIYDLEKKDAIPSVDKLVRIAQYFNVSTDYLLGLSDNPNSVIMQISTEKQKLLDEIESLSPERQKALEIALKILKSEEEEKSALENA